MKERTQRKAGAQKRASKKYPKILAIPSSQEEILAAYKITPAELRYAKRILAEVERESSTRTK